MLAVAAIIPVYNGARFVERAVRSVLAQTVAPAEFVIVDDGSTDETADLLRRLAGEHPEIRVIDKENGGQSSARNLGVRQTASPLVAFLDQDDAWYPDHIERLIEPFEARLGLGWAYSDLDRVDGDWNMVSRRFLQSRPARHPKLDVVCCLSGDMFILPSASVIARQAFEAVGGFDERLAGYEDDDLFLRMFRAGYENVFVPEALSTWRIHGESTSYSTRMAGSRLTYMRKLFAAFPDDAALDIHYARDFIAPRFRTAYLVDYLRGLREGQPQMVAAAIEGLTDILPRSGRRVRFMLGALLPLMSRYEIGRLAFRLGLHNPARRLMRLVDGKPHKR